MNIINDQGMRPAIIDAVSPFLGKVKDVLSLFREPDVYLGPGNLVASIHLFSKTYSLPGEALEKILRAAREVDYPVSVSAVSDHRIEIAIYGFVL